MLHNTGGGYEFRCQAPLSLRYKESEKEKKLQKELRRKDKALAETTALLYA